MVVWRVLLAALLVLEMAFNWSLTQFTTPCHASSDPNRSGLGPLALGALFEAAPHVGRSFQRVRGNSVCNIFPPWMSHVHRERPAAAAFALVGKGKMADELWLTRRQAFHLSARVLVAQAREYARQPPGDVQEMADGRIFYRTKHPARIVTNLVRPYGVQQEG